MTINVTNCTVAKAGVTASTGVRGKGEARLPSSPERMR